MKRLWARARPVLTSPAVRPAEVWALRAALAWVAVKLGITVDQLVH